MPNHPDGDSRNFAWVSRISGNSSCRPAPCIELLEYNGIHSMAFFPYKKLTPKCTCTAITSHHSDDYVGVHALMLIYGAFAKHYPVTLTTGYIHCTQLHFVLF